MSNVSPSPYTITVPGSADVWRRLQKQLAIELAELRGHARVKFICYVTPTDVTGVPSEGYMTLVGVFHARPVVSRFTIVQQGDDYLLVDFWEVKVLPTYDIEVPDAAIRTFPAYDAALAAARMLT
jgi:hypothetical protein